MLDTSHSENLTESIAYLGGQEDIMSSSQTTTEVIDLLNFSKRSFYRGFEITSESFERAGDLGDKEREDFFEFVRELIKVIAPEIVSINAMKEKGVELSEEAESFLKNDILFADIVNHVSEEIYALPALSDLEYSVKIFISKDMEILDWEEVVVSVDIKNKSFDDTMEIWKEIEKKVEEVMNRFKATIPSREIYEDESHITKIDEKLSIEVENIEDV